MYIVVFVSNIGAPFTAEPRLKARSVVPARACKRFPQSNRVGGGAQLS